MAPTNRRGNKQDAAADEAAASGVSDPLDTAPVAEPIADASQTRQAPNPGEESPKTPGGPSAQDMARQIARMNTNRKTEWVNAAAALGDPLGERYRAASGEPWKILMVTDLSFVEHDAFYKAPTYIQSVEIANHVILLHNGWLGPDGKVLPQPGDMMEVTDTEITYAPAMRESATPGADREPILDENGQQLYRVLTELKTTVAEVAFWRSIPAALVPWMFSKAWELSTTLPNLTSNLLPITSQQPTNNGTT